MVLRSQIVPHVNSSRASPCCSRRLRGRAEVQEARCSRRQRLYACADCDHQQHDQRRRRRSATFVAGHDIPGEWWTLFHSKPLNDLIERSLKANPDLKAAQAALMVARENVLAQRGAYYPSVTGGFSAMRAEDHRVTFRPSPTPTSELQSLHAASKRLVRAGRFRSQPANRRIAASAGTTSALCSGRDAYHAELQRRRRRPSRRPPCGPDCGDARTHHHQYRDAGDFARPVCERLCERARRGGAGIATRASRRHLAAAAEAIGAATGSAGGARRRLSQPGSAEKFELSSLQLPQELPLSLPSQLVEQRPDVRQAEENLHAASAQIGIAVANRLPNLR